MSKITEGGLSRRQFLTGSALTAGAVASLGLAGCAPKAPTEAPATGESDLAATGADGTTVRAHAAQLNPQSDPKPVSNTTCPSLFTEWKMGSLTLPNRVVKSAAGYIGVTSQGITGDLHMQHYGKLAAGGLLRRLRRAVRSLPRYSRRGQVHRLDRRGSDGLRQQHQGKRREGRLPASHDGPRVQRLRARSDGHLPILRLHGYDRRGDQQPHCRHH